MPAIAQWVRHGASKQVSGASLLKDLTPIPLQFYLIQLNRFQKLNGELILAPFLPYANTISVCPPSKIKAVEGIIRQYHIDTSSSPHLSTPASTSGSQSFHVIIGKQRCLFYQYLQILQVNLQLLRDSEQVLNKLYLHTLIEKHYALSMI